MLQEDTDAFLCDMAETYHIYDIKAHPVSVIARLAAGLREDSRIRMKIAGQKLSNTDSLLALIFDKVNWLCWTKTKDAEKGRNAPKSLYRMLTGEEEQGEVTAYATPEDFETRRRELMRKKNG